MFFLLAHITEGVLQISHGAGAHSDHSLVSLKFWGPSCMRGPGLWKFNSPLLANVLRMTDFPVNWSALPELQSMCCLGMAKIRNKEDKTTMAFSKENIPLEKRMLRELTKDLQSLVTRNENREDLADQIASTRRELEEIENIWANKLILRSRWTQLGEKPTLRRENQETRSYLRSCMMTVPLPLTQQRFYYGKLYTEDPQLTPLVDISSELEKLDHPKLSDVDLALLQWTTPKGDLQKALKQLNTNKSPGSDGLTPEFYTHFWDLISPFLLTIHSYLIDNGLLSTK